MAMSTGESVVWKGHPSQLKNFKVFVICVVTCWLIVPVFYAFWKWLEVRCFLYELTTQRLKITQGVLNRTVGEVELYRIKDTSLVEPFWMRVFGRGNVVLLTSDRSTPEIVVEAVADAEQVREKIRAQVEAVRDTKRVREIDFEMGMEP
jgi:uncharacterized membrane protein YdbT with pleckstrin-like domain